MLLHKTRKCQTLLAMFLILLQICLTPVIAYSKEENGSEIYQIFSNLFEPASKENKHLLDGWNDYLVKVKGHSNAMHLEVIEELTMDYAKAFKALDERLGKESKKEKKQYTSKWLDDLVGHFGQDFVCNNQINIVLNLMMVFERCDAKKYDQDAKEILSKEMILYLAYEEYLDAFMDYYNKLNKRDQKRMKKWKEVAEKYLSITKKSHFAPIYYGLHMRKKIDDNVMQKEHTELYMYFKDTDLSFGRGALKQAEREIDVFVENCKMQKQK